MFEVGKKYEFKRIIDGEETTMWGTVEKYEHPLLKLKDHSSRMDINIGGEVRKGTPAFTPGEIINVTSSNFISAVLRHDRT